MSDMTDATEQAIAALENEQFEAPVIVLEEEPHRGPGRAIGLVLLGVVAAAAIAVLLRRGKGDDWTTA